MSRSPVRNALRSFLKSTLDWLDRDQPRLTPRAVKPSWYRVDYDLPPVVVSALAAIVLYIILIVGNDMVAWHILSLAFFVIIAVSLFSLYVTRDHADLVRSGDALSLLAVIFLGTMVVVRLFSHLSEKVVWLSPYLAPVAIGPLLATLLLRQRLAMVLAFVAGLFAGVINGFSLEVTLVSTLGGVGMVAASSRARTAHHVAHAGLLTGLLQGLVVLFLAMTLDWTGSQTRQALVSAFLSGLGAAIVGLGLLPYLESFFSRISTIRLIDLADLNHPLLRRLSAEAPGTYHHSLTVAALAEEAANAIGANGLLCRVGAYFHDVGKIIKSEYFVENQDACENPHDDVSPSLSRVIIMAHVKEGLALAQQYGLDSQVMSFIPMHHGTSKMEFFYHKALRLEAREDEEDQENIPEEAFRYHGPRPDSRETGIVMLADSIEAASRALEEPTHQRYKDLVTKIVDAKLRDGQLDETPLTMRDLRTIRDKFVATLISIHHTRVPYPDKPSRTDGGTPA